MTACQWCDSTDTYVSGYSPMCVETEYRCRECGGRTWHDHTHDHTHDARHTRGLDTDSTANDKLGGMEDNMTITTALPTLTYPEWREKYLRNLPPSQFRKGDHNRVLWREEAEREKARTALVLEGLAYLTQAGLLADTWRRVSWERSSETVTNIDRIKWAQELITKWKERL